MRNKTLIRLGAALALLSMLAGCGPAAEPTPSPSAPAAEVTPEIQAELDAQLGLLTGYITEEERQAALDLWLQIRPIREARLAAGQWAWRPREETLLTELSALYDQYTMGTRPASATPTRRRPPSSPTPSAPTAPSSPTRPRRDSSRAGRRRS